MRFPKTHRIILLLLLAAFCSCSGGRHWKLKIEMPRPVSFELERFQELVITDFFIKKERADMDINKEMKEYFSFEFGKKSDLSISTENLELTGTDVFEDKAFWKSVAAGSDQALLFTGSIEYKSEIRKALVNEEKRQFEDPFPRDTELEQRQFYTLFFNLYLIDSKTGDTLYTRNFKETKNYINPNQTAYFAFFDLLQIVKTKLFRAFLGDDEIQERYLITQ